MFYLRHNLVLCILVLISLVFLSPIAVAGPKLVCKDTVCDFGRLEDQTAVEHSFLLENHGDQDLVIQKVRKCCGGAAKLHSTTISPGSNTILEATLSFMGKTGKILKAYYVQSNDPDQRFLRLEFKGEVVKTAVAPGPNVAVSVKEEPAPVEDVPGSSIEEPVEVHQPPVQPNVSPVIIDYFFEPGCLDCERVRQNVLPALYEKYRGKFSISEHDVGITSNYIMLVAYQETLGIEEDEDVCMVVDYFGVCNGYEAIKTGLILFVEKAIENRAKNGADPKPIEVPDHQAGIQMAENRLEGFTWPTVAIAGLVDGINPCAIGTLVFFMSLLAASKLRNKQLLMIGIPFFIASFVTYTAIGFGLLRILHAFSGFPLIQKSIEVVMITLLGVLAILSFADAYRFRKSGNPKDVTLQLPRGIKDRIHKIMREGIKARNLIVGALIIGALVTALESVCTGQVYVPTLVLVVKAGDARMAGLGYLLLYNLMFIAPLIAVFVLLYQGMKIEALLEWSKKNVVWSKILLGSLFVAMGVVIAVV